MLKSGRKEGSQPLAKPALHSELTKDPQVLAWGALRRAGETCLERVEQPNHWREQTALFVWSPQGSRHVSEIGGEWRHEQPILGSPEDPL